MVKAKAMMAKTELWRRRGVRESSRRRRNGYSQVLEDGGRDHGLVAEVALPHDEDGAQDNRENEASDDRAVVPGLGVSSPLKSENEASDRGEDEGSSQPVHVEELAKPGLRGVLLGLRAEGRGGLEEESDGEERDSSDGEVDVEAL